MHAISPAGNLVRSRMSFGPSTPELTILMPCLNEAETIGTASRRPSDTSRGAASRRGPGRRQRFHGRLPSIAPVGARVVPIMEKGYGAALIGGIAAARGRFIIMGDADDFDDSRSSTASSPNCARAASRGGQPLQGRDCARRHAAAAPLARQSRAELHWSKVFRPGIGDFHCGLRGIDAQAIRSLKLRSRHGVRERNGRAREVWGLSIAEVPTTLKKDATVTTPASTHLA